MKFYTSYFYQVRFFTPNMIPISTAVSDPKWFHRGLGPQYTYFDKRNVINGLRCQELAPGPMCVGTCDGTRGKGCSPDSCEFLKVYENQLNKDFNITNFLWRCRNIAEKVKNANHFEGEPAIVLLVHEAKNNPCSERGPILKYFNSHCIKMEEWIK